MIMTAMLALLDTLEPSLREQAEQVIKEQQRVLIDRLVRAARTEGWCGEFERSMVTIFPDGHPDSGSREPNAWLDSDGFTCRGVDRDGYDSRGFDPSTGLDRDGYDSAGRNRDGYDRDGYNRYGFNRDGYDRDGFDAEGFTAQARDREGNLAGTPEAEAYQFRYDGNGYDAEGFHGRHGTHRETGLTRTEHANRFRFDRFGNARPAS